MSLENQTPYRVHVVLESTYGERLRELAQDEPVWVVESEMNHPVIIALRQERKGRSHLDGITSFEDDASISPQEQFISMLSTIDLHHGDYSHEPPYSVLDVIGIPWSSEIQEALEELHFFKHEDTADGFVARRHPAE